ncbi:hypothetical protein AA313_de0204586 [Arthrobotrys entomopaga]|nr:hypothetical protein AA313_de0204586 [Arthrobotrys entomopaga]
MILSHPTCSRDETHRPMQRGDSRHRNHQGYESHGVKYQVSRSSWEFTHPMNYTRNTTSGTKAAIPRATPTIVAPAFVEPLPVLVVVGDSVEVPTNPDRVDDVTGAKNNTDDAIDEADDEPEVEPRDGLEDETEDEAKDEDDEDEDEDENGEVEDGVDEDVDSVDWDEGCEMDRGEKEEEDSVEA